MKRADFSLHLAGAGLTLTTPVLAQAPVEGTHFVKLSQPLPPGMLPPAGRIDVAEFFWYECPHCNAFEPVLELWARKLPADVALRRVPVGFTARHQVAQRLFYALEEIGAVMPRTAGSSPRCMGRASASPATRTRSRWPPAPASTRPGSARR